MLKITSSISIALVALSISYYFVFVLPLRESATVHPEHTETQDAPSFVSQDEDVSIEESDEEDYDLVLINYRLDSQNTSNFMTPLYGSVQTYPETFCKAAAEEANSEHLYYIYLNELNKLKDNYEEYRYDIEFIDNNLASFEGIVETVKERCAAYGFRL